MKKKIDRKLIKILAAFYGVVVLLTFSKRLYFIISAKAFENNDFSWFELIFSGTFLDWVLVVIYMLFVALLTKRMIDRNVKLPSILLTHFMLSILMTWFLFICASIINLIIGQYDLEKAINNLSINHFARTFDINFVNYFVMAAIIYVYYYVNKIKEYEYLKTKLSDQLTSAKMKALKDQLHPHFLFNTLNGISTLVKTNPTQAQNTIADLSDLLREILELKNDDFITLRKEMNVLDKYFSIMLIRFSDHLTIKTNIEENTLFSLIPAMLLQPIVENSIKYGYSIKVKKLVIELNVFKKENKLVIEVFNNGKPINKKTTISKGNGISNIMERLKALYGNNSEFYFDNIESGGVITRIIIPFVEETTLA
ncbi:histidine kinase [Pontimicrobium sp. SW4]|uniref:Histidine kinase n=1 Tax=Pontimicrobium sp. SW4 TaxID=3153519 RepID=A0AAU7BRF8_9FLAO